MPMTHIKFPLFWKFSIAIIMIVALFGTINTLLITRSVSASLEKELAKRGEFIGNSLAKYAVRLLLYEDYVTLQDALVEARAIDETIAYIFIVDQNSELIVHTFGQNFPRELLAANKLQPGGSKNISLIAPKSSEHDVLCDIAIPLLQGKLGTIRIGVHENEIRYYVDKTTHTFFIMIALFLGAGIIGAFAFSFVITQPIKDISEAASKLDFMALKKRSYSQIKERIKLPAHWKLPWRSNDELDLLIDTFQEMITRLENTYAELEAVQSVMIQTEKMASLGTLAAGIAHEINNPIAGLKNCIRRMQKNPENRKQNEKYLQMMAEAVDKITRVERGMLAYARKEDIVFTEIDCREVIEKALLLLEFKLEKYEIAIDKDIDGKMPLISGSFNQLEQVIVNLLMNSLDALNENGAAGYEHERKIAIALKEEKRFLILSIADTGAGIPEKHREKIFDPFFTTKAADKGTGLGLAVCYKIIQAHRGRIEVACGNGAGAEFSIYLPLAQEKDFA